MRSLSLALAVAVSCAAVLVAPSSALAASSHPRISKTYAFDAPLDEPGGIMTPYVSCSDYRVEPRARTTMSGVDSDYHKTFRWAGAYPSAHFPRVAVGDYKVRTVAFCDGVRRVRTQTVVVDQKTPATTISRAEFKRVKVGMTPTEVADIVGYGGTSISSYRGTESRLYDNMTFWAWSIIDYRRGVVSRKSFDVGHD